MPTSSRPQVNEYSHIGNSDRDPDEDGSEFTGQNKGHTVKSQNQLSYDPERRNSFASEDGDPLLLEIPTRTVEKEKLVSWMSLPRKSQLAILTLARLSEPLVQSSLRVSIPYSFRR
jgi:hypothetical protein